MSSSAITLIANSPLLGGAERYAIELYRQLSRTGIRTSLVGSLPGWVPECGERTDIGISDKWDGRNIPKILRSAVRDHRVLASSLERVSGVAHCQYKREQVQFTRTLARHHPVYWTEHGVFRTSPRARAMQLAYKAAARDISGIICVSNSVADSVRPALRPGANITVIPNGVDLDLYKPASEHEKRIARETLGLKRDVPTMLWIGAARQGKLPQLVGATAQLFRGQSLLVGDGPERGSLIEASRADNVSYAGHLEDPAIAYAAADVMIFTSTGAGEGAPLVLLEAAACGVPVLSHYGCGVEAMVTNVGGVLVGKKASELASGAELAAAGGYNAAGVAWAAERSSSEAAKLHAQFMGLPC